MSPLPAAQDGREGSSPGRRDPQPGLPQLFPSSHLAPRFGTSGPEWISFCPTRSRAGSLRVLRLFLRGRPGLACGVGGNDSGRAVLRTSQVKMSSHTGWPEVTPPGEGAQRVAGEPAVTAPGVCLTDSSCRVGLGAPPGPMELEGQWWRGQLAADIHQALRYKVTPRPGLLLLCLAPVVLNLGSLEGLVRFFTHLSSGPEKTSLLICSRLINFLAPSLGCIRRTCNLNGEGDCSWAREGGKGRSDIQVDHEFDLVF